MEHKLLYRFFIFIGLLICTTIFVIKKVNEPYNDERINTVFEIDYSKVREIRAYGGHMEGVDSLTGHRMFIISSGDTLLFDKPISQDSIRKFLGMPPCK